MAEEVVRTQRQAHDEVQARREEAHRLLREARVEADELRRQARAMLDEARGEVTRLRERRDQITAELGQLSGVITALAVPERPDPTDEDALS